MGSLWAYSYEIVPPQPSSRLGAIRTLLKDETAAAHGDARTWAGKLVLEQGATHILIVSDAVGQDGAINHRLAAELERLDATFFVTEPLAVSGDAAGAEGLATYAGNGR